MTRNNDGSNHCQFKAFLNVLINSGKYFDVNTPNFTDELSVVKLCQNPLLSDYISKWLSKLNQNRERTLEVAREYLYKGNSSFDSFTGRNDLSADYYTKAIFSAPKGSVELAMAHADRAACCLSSERFYEEGYFDCKIALQLKLQDNLPMLLERMLWLAHLSDKRDEYVAETKMKITELLGSQESLIMKNNPAIERKLERLINYNNQWNDEATMQIKNKNLIETYNSSGERSLITDEAIKRNEQIYCEKAFAFVPCYDYRETDLISYTCQHCGKINCLPFPCYDCARASYCSPQCLASHQPIHKYECVGHQKNLWVKSGVGYLAFRTCIVGFKEVVEILEKNRASTVEAVWATLQLDCHREFAYGNVLRLPSHIDRMDVKVALQYGLIAQLFTVYLVEYTEFFNDLPPVCSEILANVDDWKTVVAALMVKHMVQSYLCGHSGNQLQLIPPSKFGRSYGYGSYNIHLDDLHLVLLRDSPFSAFYPLLSMANHSCDPNVHIIFNGDDMYAYAIRNIGPNEELFISYVLDYKQGSTVERNKQLQADFRFKCKCHRCETYDTTWMKYFEYYCTDPKCNVFVELDDVVDRRWWLSMDPEYENEISDKFVCFECGDALPMNPAMWRKFQRTAMGFIEKRGYEFRSTDKFIITKNLLDLYFQVSKCMGKYHELKSRLTYMILVYLRLDIDVRLFPRMAYITMEDFENRSERFGRHTLEFTMKTPYALSILKIANRIERTNTLAPMERDIAKIRRILNVAVIEKSLQILPQSLRKVFQNIIRDLNVRPAIDHLAEYDEFNICHDFDCNSFNSERSTG